VQKYKIPQEVQREDRIFGPITMRRLIILCLGGGLTWLLYMKLGKSGGVTWIVPVFFSGTLTLAFAFVEPFGMKFGKFLSRMFEYSFLPKKRIWDKRFTNNALIAYQRLQQKKWEKKQKTKENPVSVLEKKEAQRKKISSFSPLLDSDLSEVDLSLYKKHASKK
jgi:hypothetical protein